MKLCTVALVATALSGTHAFSTSAPSRQKGTALSLDAVDRRSFASAAGLAFVAGVATGGAPEQALARGLDSNYKPKYDDLKQIYGLGVTLDNLSAKVSDEDKWEAALEGLRSFNKDPGFYPGYARNYIAKSVKSNADGDSRVGYIRQACSQIGSIQELLEGRQGLTGSAASDEAVGRVKNAQRLIGKFLAESGVEDDKVKAYVASHQ